MTLEADHGTAWWETDDEPVHLWFGLSYANYLVLNRSLMQSMPLDWQRRMVACLDELDRSFAHVVRPYSYLVRARNAEGRFVRDPVPHYDRGRAKVRIGHESEQP